MNTANRPTLPADAEAALRAHFGDAPVESLAPLGGGLSRALVVAFTVGGHDYVLRRSHPEQAPRGLSCLRIAAARGVAPPLHYADDRTGLSISDRVHGEALGRDQSLAPSRVERVARALRRLHDGPAFPAGPTLAGILDFFESHLTALTGRGLPPELIDVLGAVSPCVKRFASAAPCHLDLNPNNVIETATEVFFVDWDTAGAGNPFVDLAQLGVFALPAPAERNALLAEYLGRAPNDAETARATLSRVAVLGCYAAAFLHVRALTGAPMPSGDVPPWSEMLRVAGAERERTPPGALAVSLLREMTREAASDSFAAARARLAP